MASFIDPSTVTRTVLGNGLTVLVRRDMSAPLVAIVTHVKVGYFDETDDVSGIAHVLEHMYFKGTQKRGVGDIAKETKSSGGYLNAHTSYDQTVYYTVLPSSGFAAGLDIQADAYANSVIDSGELEKELEVIIQEAKRKTDNPSAVASETLYEVLHDRHRIRRWRIGHEAGLRALDRAAMMRFYRNFYRPSNTILTVVGDVDVDDALGRIEAAYGGLEAGEPQRSPGPAETHHAGTRYREFRGDIAQAQLVLGWRTQHTMHEDKPVLDVAAHVLAGGRASRLYRALRERQLASRVRAMDFAPTEIGVFVVHAEAQPETVVDAARAVWEQLRILREGPIDQAEIERVRRIYEAAWMRTFESMEGQANHLAGWEALGGWRLGDDYFARFMSVTSHDVHEVASRYLTEESAGIVVYAPSSSPHVAASAADFLVLLEEGKPAPLDPLPPRDIPTPPREADAVRIDKVDAGVHVFRTAAGAPILVRPKPGAAFANVAVYAVGGVRDETPSQGGITRLAMNASVKGTSTRSAAQIAEDAEMLGGTISPNVGAEHFGWSVSVPVQHLEAAVELLADIVHDAVIPDDAFETERAVMLADLASLRDDMFRFPVRLAVAAAYDGHPYAQSPLGTEASLKGLNVEDVRQWYRGKLLATEFVTGIVGDVIPEDAADVLARELGPLRASRSSSITTPAWPREHLSSIDEREKAQTALAMLFDGPARTDDRRFAALLTATIASGLGGRFFDELRDRQSLAYTVMASASERAAGGTFMSYIATSPEKEDVARRGLLAEFQRFREELVTDEELARAKRYLIGSHAISQESGAAILGDMIDAWMFGTGVAELAEFDARIGMTTAGEIRELALQFFDPSRRVEGIVRGIGKVV